MNKTNLINSICTNLNNLASLIKVDGKTNRHSINISAEDFAVEFFNVLEDLELENMNNTKFNMPGIDLIDSTNKIMYQVSSTATKDKIKKTFDKIAQLDNIKEYEGYTIRFFFLVNKVNIKLDKTCKCPEGLSFNQKVDIIDINSLTVNVSHIKEIQKIKELNRIVNNYFNPQFCNIGDINVYIKDRFEYFASIDDKLDTGILHRAEKEIMKYVQQEYIYCSTIHSFASPTHEFDLKNVYQTLTLTQIFSRLLHFDIPSFRIGKSYTSDYSYLLFDKENNILNPFVHRHNDTKIVNTDKILNLSLSHASEIEIKGFPEDEFAKGTSNLIVDTAGMGKSTMCKRIFIDIIDRKLGIPIFIELRNINQNNTLINEILNKCFGDTSDVSKRIFNKLIEKGNFIFIFDGYDEIARECKQEVTKQMQDLLPKLAMHKNCNIMTSREEDELESFRNFKRYTIDRLTQEEAFQLISKFDNNGIKSHELIELLKNNQNTNINEYLENPLLISLVYAAYDYEPILPTKRSEFYEKVFEAMFKKHDLTKGQSYIHEKKTNLSFNQMYSLLRFIAFKSEIQEITNYTITKLYQFIQDAQKATSIKSFNPDDFIYDISTAVPLFVKEEKYNWAHKSLREFFAAQHIAIDTGSKKENILRKMTTEDNIYKCQNILKLYDCIDHNTFRSLILFDLYKEYIDFCTNKGVNIRSTKSKKKAVSLMYLFRLVVFPGGVVNSKKRPFPNHIDDIHDRYKNNVKSKYHSNLYYNIGFNKRIYTIATLLDDKIEVEDKHPANIDIRGSILVDNKELNNNDVIKYYRDCQDVCYYLNYDKIYKEYKEIEKDIADKKEEEDIYDFL